MRESDSALGAAVWQMRTCSSPVVKRDDHAGLHRENYCGWRVEAIYTNTRRSVAIDGICLIVILLHFF